MKILRIWVYLWLLVQAWDSGLPQLTLLPPTVGVNVWIHHLLYIPSCPLLGVDLKGVKTYVHTRLVYKCSQLNYS